MKFKLFMGNTGNVAQIECEVNAMVGNNRIASYHVALNGSTIIVAMVIDEALVASVDEEPVDEEPLRVRLLKSKECASQLLRDSTPKDISHGMRLRLLEGKQGWSSKEFTVRDLVRITKEDFIRRARMCGKQQADIVERCLNHHGLKFDMTPEEIRDILNTPG
ncbi:MAG: hypothetical protein KBD15_04240 [Candidatus Magasanikbacteria bacterium]|nr:hypothetical protein [Candidatus Magasanikbacteria bacterium]